jgi:hypothetical protein
MASRFLDGQLFLDLRGSTQPLAPLAILRHVLWSRQPNRHVDDDGRLEAAYRSAIHGQRLLLVLDDAASLEQIVPALPLGDGTVVVT